MTGSLHARLQPLLQEVRANPRLLAGLAVIGALVLGWFFLVLGDWRAARLAELEQTRQRLVQVQQLADQEEWPERAAEAVRLADALDAEIPEAASPGLAQADFQGWLREIADAQPGELRLDVQQPTLLEQPTGVVRVAGTISGSLAPNRVVQVIHRIEGRTSLATVPVATIRSDGLNQTFSITVHGFYRLANPEEQP